MTDVQTGDRVRLVRTTDEHTRLQPGTLGTVRTVDSLGTIHVDWDSGESLGICIDAGDRILFEHSAGFDPWAEVPKGWHKHADEKTGEIYLLADDENRWGEKGMICWGGPVGDYFIPAAWEIKSFPTLQDALNDVYRATGVGAVE